jgi:hypothetical protein
MADTREHRTQLRAEEQDSTREAATEKPGRPRSQFGVRLAVLAGVIVATGGTTAGLGSPISSVVGSGDTTCCRGGGSPSISRTV